MQWAVVFVIAVFLLITCQDDKRSTRAAQEARIEREVKQRVEREVAAKTAAIEEKYGVRKAQLRTIRVVGFILLAGGALGGLIRLQRHRPAIPLQSGERQLRTPAWRDHHPVPTTRVLDLQPGPSPASIIPPATPAPPEAWMDDNTPPRRRARRRRHRNRNPNRNQDHDATPRHR